MSGMNENEMGKSEAMKIPGLTDITPASNGDDEHKFATSKSTLHGDNDKLGHCELNKVVQDIVDSETRTCTDLGENKRKLVLHFDVRNTVLVADSVTNVNVEQALNSFLTSVTWGKEVNNRWQWFSDEPSLTQPQPGLITYYKHLEKRLVSKPSDRALLRQVTGDLTQEPIGERFLPYFKEHLKSLRWPEDKEVTSKTLVMEGSDGRPYHYILPAFFQLIHHLHKEGRKFCVIIRTYGLDAPNVLACTDLTLKGNHPQFPEKLPIHVQPEPGKVFRTKSGKICFESYSEDSTGKLQRETFTGEEEIYSMLSNQTGVSAFVDDFIYWQDSDYHHTAGKPVWIDPKDTNVHHIIFDDNIRTTEADSIVDLRLLDQEMGTGRSLNLEETVDFENLCLVQADLLESICNVDYFVDKVKLCEENYSKYLMSGLKK